MAIAFLEPDNIDDALLNWAAWHSDTYDANDPLNAVSLRFAIAVDNAFDLLHHREKIAIRANYLRDIPASNVRKPLDVRYWTHAALHTGKQAIEQMLRNDKLLKG